MAPSASVATVGLTSDAGIASAMLNTSSRWVARSARRLLNPGRQRGDRYAWPTSTATRWPRCRLKATVHGYRVVFTYAAVFLVRGRHRRATAPGGAVASLG